MPSRKYPRRQDLKIDSAAENVGVRPTTPNADMSVNSAATGQYMVSSPDMADVTPHNSIGSAHETEHKHIGSSKLALYTRRFFRNKTAVVGLVIFALLVLLATFGGMFTQWAYDEPDFFNLAMPPSAEHWFGTNDSGNDLFAQTVHGLGRSLTIAVTVSLATLVLSALIGAGAAMFGGRVEKIILAIIHFLLAVPSFLMIALIVSDSGGDWKLLIVVLILFGWMYPARVIWSLALSVRENDYVRAAGFMGVPKFKIIVRHLIPNIGSLLIIQLVLTIVSTIMSETALSFLGLGVKMPDVSLGTLLSVGAGTLESTPWQFYFPAAVLTLLTVSVSFIADGLRDALDPNSMSGGKA